MYKIKNWSVAPYSPYQPPEDPRITLVGEVTNHHKYPGETRRLQTSLIVRTQGRFVYTYTGSVYELEEPHPEYIKWCNENNHTIDEEQPIKIVDSYPFGVIPDRVLN